MGDVLLMHLHMCLSSTSTGMTDRTHPGSFVPRGITLENQMGFQDQILQTGARSLSSQLTFPQL